jgi:pSer/pThr/pTyr-binding forkhead associated (FHA) protein
MNSPATPIESNESGESLRNTAKIAVQIRNRQQAQISKHDIREDGLTIGRGWHCDVILTDSAADAVHAKLLIDTNGHWLLEDADSTNGTTLNGTQLNPGQRNVAVASGDTITIGRTRITLYDPTHPVATAKSPALVDNARDILGSPGWALLISLLCLSIAMLFNYLEETGQYKPDQLVIDLLTIASIGIGFTLFWAVVGKLVRGEANLLANWSLGMLSVAVAAVSTDLTEWLSFNMQSLAAYTWLQAGAAFVILFLALLFALAFTTNLSKPSRLMAALIPPVILLFVNTIMPMVEEDKPVNWPPAMLISRPPALQLIAPTAIETYLQDSQDLFSQTRTTAQAATKEAQAHAAEEVLTP